MDGWMGGWVGGGQGKVNVFMNEIFLSKANNEQALA